MITCFERLLGVKIVDAIVIVEFADVLFDTSLSDWDENNQLPPLFTRGVPGVEDL